MDVREFLHQNRMELQELAKLSGVNKQTLSALKCHNAKPSFKTATMLVEATNYHIGYSDLMPEMFDAMVVEYQIKTRGVKNGSEN